MIELRIAQPMPDEFISGHIGRMAFINGFRSINGLIDNLTAHSRENYGVADPLEIYQRLAHVIGMDPDEYLKWHTLMPIDRISSSEPDDISSYALPRINHQRTNLLKLSTAAGFCIECSNDDVRQYGFSYWRRIHQLHGIEWCLHHKSSLHYSRGEVTFERQPHQVNSDMGRFTEPYSEHPLVRTYAELSKYLLNNPKRLHRKHISSVINAQGKKLSLVVSAHHAARRVSSLCREALPAQWAQAFFPSLHATQEGVYCPSIDGACRAIIRTPGVSQILAISAVFQNHDAAINALNQSSVSLMGAVNLKKLSVRGLYFEVSGCTESLSKRLNLPNSTLSTFMKSEGLPVMRSVDSPVRMRVLNLLGSASEDELARWKNCYTSNFGLLKGSGLSMSKRSKILSEMLDVVFSHENVSVEA